MLVAERIMGLEPADTDFPGEYQLRRPDGSVYYRGAVPRYSSDIAAAWQVVPHLGLD
jgi:hypothetical protein